MISAERVYPFPKSERYPERERIIENLRMLGDRTGNPLVFREVGYPESNPYSDLKEEFARRLSADDLSLARELQAACHRFQVAPIFTDSFHKDNSARRIWEKNLEALDKPSVDYYHTNRLATNFCDSVCGLLRSFVETIDDAQTREDFVPLLVDIPRAFRERNETGNLKYDLMNDEEKIDVSHEVDRLAGDILKKLEV